MVMIFLRWFAFKRLLPLALVMAIVAAYGMQQNQFPDRFQSQITLDWRPSNLNHAGWALALTHDPLAAKYLAAAATGFAPETLVDSALAVADEKATLTVTTTKQMAADVLQRNSRDALSNLHRAYLEKAFSNDPDRWLQYLDTTQLQHDIAATRKDFRTRLEQLPQPGPFFPSNRPTLPLNNPESYYAILSQQYALGEISRQDAAREGRRAAQLLQLQSFIPRAAALPPVASPPPQLAAIGTSLGPLPTTITQQQLIPAKPYPPAELLRLAFGAAFLVFICLPLPWVDRLARRPRPMLAKAQAINPSHALGIFWQARSLMIAFGCAGYLLPQLMTWESATGYSNQALLTFAHTKDRPKLPFDEFVDRYANDQLVYRAIRSSYLNQTLPTLPSQVRTKELPTMAGILITTKSASPIPQAALQSSVTQDLQERLADVAAGVANIETLRSQKAFDQFAWLYGFYLRLTAENPNFFLFPALDWQQGQVIADLNRRVQILLEIAQRTGQLGRQEALAMQKLAESSTKEYQGTAAVQFNRQLSYLKPLAPEKAQALLAVSHETTTGHLPFKPNEGLAAGLLSALLISMIRRARAHSRRHRSPTVPSGLAAEPRLVGR